MVSIHLIINKIVLNINGKEPSCSGDLKLGFIFTKY